MNIGTRMKEKRMELNLTLQEVAKVVGVSRQTIQKYESGVISNIPSDKIELLAFVLRTTPSYLMGWDSKASVGPVTFYDAHCKTENETELLLSYRKLSDTGKKKVYVYTNNLLDLEEAEIEVKAAHNNKASDPEELEKINRDLSELKRPSE